MGIGAIRRTRRVGTFSGSEAQRKSVEGKGEGPGPRESLAASPESKPRSTHLMSKSVPSSKITLAAPETIPLDKLSVHEANVRQIKSGPVLDRKSVV